MAIYVFAYVSIVPMWFNIFLVFSIFHIDTFDGIKVLEFY